MPDLRTGVVASMALFLAGCATMVPQQQLLQGDSMRVRNSIYSHCEAGMDARTPASYNGDQLDPASISLLNWNIYKGQRNNWADDLHSFIGSRDLVTIQEAHLSDRLRSVLAEHNYQWTLNAAFHLDDRPSGVMTASRVAALNTCGLRHAEPLIRLPKTALVSYYPIRGHDSSLLVANIHGINFTLGTVAYRRQIQHLFDIIQVHDGPVIIAGDFNTWSNARMAIVMRYANAVGLSSLDYQSHNRTRVFGKELDHVFFRGLQPLTHHSWHVTSSDHNPTRVRFRML